MKLYMFSTYGCYGKPKVTMEEYEVEEKPKSYIGIGKSKGRRFNKSDVGVATGFNNNEVLLSENNPSKACEILLEEKTKELIKIEEQLTKKKEEIQNLLRYMEN